MCACMRAQARARQLEKKDLFFFVLIKTTEREESVFALHSLDSQSLPLLRRRRKRRRGRQESMKRRRERGDCWRRKTGRKRSRR